MLRAVAPALVLTALVVANGIPARAAEPETVTVTSSLASKGPFTARLLRPAGPGPFPAVVALHGCGGLSNSRGQLRSRETDWADRFLAAGYAVLFPDSFTARGLREICTGGGERSVFPKDRAEDALAAGEWLAAQPFIDRRRLALMGWSHGAMAVLWAVRPGSMGRPPLFRTAIAFYPGCRQIDRLEDWRPSIPLTLLIGSADDWTRPAPCRSLAKRTGFRFIEYEGAYHGFDAPNARVRVREGLARPKDGKAHVGTDRTARAASIKEVMAILREAFRTP